MKVLVVDADDSLRGVIRDLLTEVGCNAVSFASCEDSLRLARHGSPSLDLILLDLEPDEIVVARRRLAPRFVGTPIVGVRAGDYEATVETALAVSRAERKQRTKGVRRLTARIQRLKKSNDDLKRSVCIDQLTGIANRNHFDSLLNTEWRRAARDRSPLSLVMLDLDYFHALNERYGHLGGDECLKRVADAMAHCLRRPSDIVARYGGEEFVALLPDTDATGACVVAERLRTCVEQLQLPHASSRCNSVVTISAGVGTSVPRLDRACETLVAAVDLALFRAKAEGRNRIAADTVASARVVVSRRPWPTCPVVLADPSLAPRIAKFLETKTAEVSSIREAARTSDFGAVSAMAHTLRRTSAAYGFAALFELAQRLEVAAARSEREDVLGLLDELAWYLDHVQVVYRSEPSSGVVSRSRCKPDHDSTRS